MQMVSSGARPAGEVARVDIVAEAMPIGLTLEIQPAGGVRGLNPDAIFTLHPGAGPGIERRVWIESD